MYFRNKRQVCCSLGTQGKYLLLQKKSKRQACLQLSVVKMTSLSRAKSRQAQSQLYKIQVVYAEFLYCVACSNCSSFIRILHTFIYLLFCYIYSFLTFWFLLFFSMEFLRTLKYIKIYNAVIT